MSNARICAALNRYGKRSMVATSETLQFFSQQEQERCLAQEIERDCRVSPAKGPHRYGTVLKLDQRRAKAQVLWDGESRTGWWFVAELVRES